MTCGFAPWKTLKCIRVFVCPLSQCMHLCSSVLNVQLGWACCVYAFVFEKKKTENACVVTVNVIHGTSCILERHCGLQGERTDPLHHHYHYHHQSSFEWRSWTRQCTEPLAWLHVDIFEMGKMEGEKGLRQRMKETGNHGEKDYG